MQEQLFISGHKVLKTIEPLIDLRQTGKLMVEMATKFSKDIPLEMLAWSCPRFFDYVKRLPFRSDPDNIESVQRPKFTLDKNWDGPRDCDDKAVTMGSWFFQRKIPFRFIACSYEKENDLEHAIVEIFPFDSDYPILIDATYSHIKFPSEKKYFNTTAISEWIK